MEDFFGVVIGTIIIIGIIWLIYICWDYATRPQRFADKIKEIKGAGYRVVYQNETTGTISYMKNGVRCQVSVYRGYNSHAR